MKHSTGARDAFSLLAFLFLALLAAEAGAVPPLPGLKNPDRPTCYLNAEAGKQRAAAFLKAAPGMAAPISSTTYNIAVIRVDFSDKTMSVTRAATESFFNRVKNFYLENSFNFMTASFTVSGGGAGAQSAFRMPRTHAFYAFGIQSNYSQIARDAIALATAAGFNFTGYDHVMFYHAGSGSETSSSPNTNIWSVYAPSSLLSGPNAGGGKTFPGATFVPESESSGVDPLGVVCHEYGHQLGLPDLYNTDNGSTQVGKWSLMDSGVYIGFPALGDNPAHLDAWSKQFLGFSSPETISLSQGSNRSLGQAETNRGAFIRVPISVSDVGGDNEYFLIEYRRKSGATYDNELPGEGLLIWHIDDSIAANTAYINANVVNNTAARRGVDLVEADGSDSTDGGTSGDPWPGSTNNTIFKTPKANAYNTKDSGVEASGITGSGGNSMSFTIKNLFNNPAFAGLGTGGVLITGGAKGFVNPKLNESALIAVKPSVSGAMEIKVYSLAGDLVFQNTFAGTANQSTVVQWNGKNTDGDAVASGIYVAMIKGGGIDTKKKIAVVK